MAVTDDPLKQPPKKPNSTHLFLLPHIDLSTLSQSELRSLSVLSNSAFNLHDHHLSRSRSDDFTIPKLNPSLFNESAGGCKQMRTSYSPRKSASSSSSAAAAASSCGGGGGHRLRFSIHVSPTRSTTGDDDRDRLENELIVNFFKKFMEGENPPLLEGSEKALEVDRAKDAESGEIKRRRVRKRKSSSDDRPAKVEGGDGSVSVEIVNRNGVVVDLLALKSVGDPYGEELRRRTVGMEKEQELLGFLRGLDGQWCSRRKKRRIVEASLLSDVLPVGWKVIIALRRKSGRYSPYCRRLISPTGEHFLSCKEASSYLRSYFGLNNAKLMNELCQKDSGADSEKKTATMQQYSGINPVHCNSVLSCSDATNLSSSYPKGCKDNSISGIDNLPDVQVSDLFECDKCKVSFGKKDAYVKHLLLFHEKTTRRFRVGSPIGRGVIIRDGKYECQFCHKLFIEKKRYSGHVGVHVRNFNRGSEELPDHMALKCKESSSLERTPSGNSKMDALIAIAQNSFEVISASGPDKETSGDPLDDEKMQLGSSFQVETEITSGDEEDDDSSKALSPIEEHRKDAVENKEQVDISNDCQQRVHYTETSQCDSDKATTPLDEVTNAERNDLPDKAKDSDNRGSTNRAGEGHASTVSAAPPISPNYSEALGVVSDKEGRSTCNSNTRLKNVVPFDDFVLDEIESKKFDAVASHEPSSLFSPDPESVDFTGFTLGPQIPPCGLELATVPNAALRSHDIVTMCVWCGLEFYPEVTLDTESDSVGFMCPACRSKIYRQINELEGSLPKSTSGLP